MIGKNHFPKGTKREAIVKSIEDEGFIPILIEDKPNFIYKTHQHPEAKLIVCLEGSMKVKILDENYDFEPGDRLLIPGNTPHSALVGDQGCIFYWAEKILS